MSGCILLVAVNYFKLFFDIFNSISWVSSKIFINRKRKIDKCWKYEIFFSFQSADNSNAAEMIVPLIQLFWSFALILFFCEFGAMVTGEFVAFNERLHQCNWYFFPIEVQRIFLIFMLDAQEPMLICGYGNITCTRDSFKNVIIVWDFFLQMSVVSVSIFLYISLFQTVHTGFSHFLLLSKIVE